MIRRDFGRVAGVLVLAGLALVWSSVSQIAGATKSDSKVNITATATAPDSDGKQVVTINLVVEKDWHAYANPIGQENFAGCPTTVSVAAKEKPRAVAVDYPKGKAEKDFEGKDYFVYEGRTVIKATVQRARGDTSPLEVSVMVQTCSGQKKCLLPATVKLIVK